MAQWLECKVTLGSGDGSVVRVQGNLGERGWLSG